MRYLILSICRAKSPVSFGVTSQPPRPLSSPLLALLTMCLLADPTWAQRLPDLAEKQQWNELREAVQKSGRTRDEIDEAQPDGMTALHWAVFHRHALSIELLLDNAADSNAKNRYGVRPLMIACRAGDEDAVESLIQADADVNAAGSSGETPLMLAARHGNSSVIELLLDADAKTDAADRAGQTAVMWAAAAGNVEALQSLIDHGADYQQSLPSGFNAFFFAVRQGHIKVVETLIDAGVDVNEPMQVKKSAGRHALAANTSALVLAVENGHFELALNLVDRGADPNDQRTGFAPLHIISWVRKPDRGEDTEPPVRGSGKVTSAEFVRQLVAAGADVNLPIENGKAKGKAKLNSDKATPMHYAAKTADTRLLKLLVELGGDIHATNADGVTPLLAVCGVGVTAVDEEAGTEVEVLEALSYLIDQGAEIDTVSKKGDTAMHGAAMRAFPRVIAYLHQHGLESTAWNHKDSNNWSPFDIADGKRPGSVKPNPAVRRALQDALVVDRSAVQR
jgi:uncharacterized protein